MEKMAQNEIIVGLDIGTTKILCLVAEVTPSGDVEIIGVNSRLDSLHAEILSFRLKRLKSI